MCDSYQAVVGNRVVVGAPREERRAVPQGEEVPPQEVPEVDRLLNTRTEKKREQQNNMNKA